MQHESRTSETRSREEHLGQRPLGWILVVSGALAACGGGGGGSSGGSGGDLNQGSYTLADFHYVDTRPPGFQPLGEDGFQVLSRDELFAVVPAADGVSRSTLMLEGPDAGNVEIAGMLGLFGPGENVHDAARGQLDQDPESELVVATIAGGGQRLTVDVVNREAGGTWRRDTIQTITASSWSFAAARVTLGDVDHDFRDEVIVSARSAAAGTSATHGKVWVFDDPQDGGAELMSFARDAGHIDIVGLPIDSDGDGRDEVVVGLAGDTTSNGRYSIRLFALDEGAARMRELHGWIYLVGGTSFLDSRAVVGDFDGDGREDIAALSHKRDASSTTIRVDLFARGTNGAWTVYANTANIDVSRPSFAAGSWAATAFQPSIGRTDLAVASPGSGSVYDYSVFHYNASRRGFEFRGTIIDRFGSNQGIALAAGDVDADGKQEVEVALLRYGTSGTLDIGTIVDGTRPALTWQPRRTLAGGSSTRPPVPVLAPGDYDADGLALRFTGRRSTRLGDPIPIVVLAAAPTETGISQNYDDTESSYSTGETVGTSIGVTTATAVTYSAHVGYTLFDVFSFGGRASLSKATERTSTHSRRQSVVQGYRGSHDHDVIVFQGTLYETYEYLIVSASEPDAIGRTLTLDVPVDANVYNWTVDYYNQHVAPEDQIGADLLTHTPGDAASYPTRNELFGLMQGQLHWDLPGVHPVGQGTASDFQSVSFEVENATEEQRSVTIGYGGGASFGLPFFEIGADVDAENTEGATYGLVYASETSFEASVGHIENPDDYQRWRYNWGFTIQTVGHLANANNEPTGYDGRKHSFQYLRYWVEPTGTGY